MEKNYKKNYLVLSGLIILTLVICLAFYNIYNIIENKKISSSPLGTSTSTVLYKDLYNTTKDLDADTFLVISYTETDKIYNTEKNIKKFLKKKNLLDNVIYLDVTEERNSEGFIDEINTTLALNSEKIKTLPAVVFYKDGVPMYVIDSTDHLLGTQDFEKLMDMYEIAS